MKIAIKFLDKNECNFFVFAVYFTKMKMKKVICVWLFYLFFTVPFSLATIRYVVSSGSTPTAPYTSWATAANDIQTAVNACSPGDEVWVSNGIYTVASGNQVVLITSAITLKSVNGPSVTIIDAGNVTGIKRGVHITSAASGAVVEGFTIRRGRADNDWGGGVKIEAGLMHNCVISNNWCSNNGDAGGILVAGGTVSNCIITKNGAWVYGGGAQINSGTIKYSFIYDNTCGSNASYGGGGVYINGGTALLEYTVIRGNRSGTSAYGGGVHITSAGGIVRNCLIWRNTGAYAGGVYMQGGVIQNCTIVYNRNIAVPTGRDFYQTGGSGENLIIWGNEPNFNRDKVGCPNIYRSGGTLTYSCSLPLQAGTGNISAEPVFVDFANGDFRLAPGSPGIDLGNTLPSIPLDLDGRIRPQDGDGVGGALYDMGCYESEGLNSGAFRCSFSVSTNEGFASVQVVLRPRPAGVVTNILWYGWDIGNDGSYEFSGSGSGIVTNTFSAGIYDVALRLTNTSFVAATCVIREVIRVAAPVIYVRPPPGVTPVAPYNSWDNAATNIAMALRYASLGSTVWLTNGTYNITGQVEVVKGVMLRGVNGSGNTLIRRASGYTRVMMVAHSNAVVEGMRLENGWIMSNVQGGAGGGLLLVNGVVRDSVIATNFSDSNGNGGGVWMTGGRLERCVVTRNRGWIRGGGIYLTGGVIDRCRITTNRCGFNAAYSGGGIYMSGGVVRNSILNDNQSGISAGGGGIYLNGGVVENCTIAHNVAGSSKGGGIYRNSGAATNCILYYNLWGSSSDNYAGNLSYISYSCAPELTGGTGNITNEPSFFDPSARDYHLTSSSYCIDRGTNLVSVTNDFEGNIRPQNGDGIGETRHDIGAYERLDASLGPLNVDFSGSQVEGLGVLETVFTATFTGSNTNIIYYGWDFNNDGEKEIQGANHSVVTNTFGPGYYSVSLVVSNAIMENAQRIRLNYIHVSPYVIYVAPNGGNQIPYTNWSTSANNIGDAVSFAVDGAVLKLSNGAYNLSSTLVIGKNITIQGVYGASNTVLRRVGTANMRVVYLDAAGAVLDGLRVTNGYDNSSSFNGIGIFMTKGTVRNCIIEKNTIAGNAHGGGIYMMGGLLSHSIIRYNKANLYGGGIYITGGVISNCIITLNQAGTWNAGFGGGGVYQSGGIIRNCLISGNKGGSGATGGGINTTGGILESSTITGNKGGTIGGGVYCTGGSVTNCIIWDNQIEPAVSNNVGGTLSAYWYCCAGELTNWANSNITANPVFETPGNGYGLSHSNGYYMITLLSPCLNRGKIKSWMLYGGVTDLSGGKRVSRKGRVDIGAYENQAPTGTILIIQ